MGRAKHMQGSTSHRSTDHHHYHYYYFSSLAPCPMSALIYKSPPIALATPTPSARDPELGNGQRPSFILPVSPTAIA